MNFQCKLTSASKKVYGAILAGLILCSTLHVNAQNPITINSDNSVTITYIDPKAEKVEVQGTFFQKGNSLIPMAGMFSKDGKAEMTNTGNGVWTYTSQPLSSELYWYDFVVNEDSVRFDKRNRDTTRDIGTTYNYFIIKGGIGDNFTDAQTKKGTLKYNWYPSSLNGMSKQIGRASCRERV